MVIPQPSSLSYEGRPFTLTPDVAISAGAHIDTAIVHNLAKAVEEVTGKPPRLGEGGAITLELPGDTYDLGVEGYELTVAEGGVKLGAVSPRGLFYAVQTLRQLLPEPGTAKPITLPGMKIRDKPRYGWRGAMLDVARHFFPVQDVKRYIDHIAAYKMNILHLHLTDDQGWRLEIEGWPRLTEVGGRTAVGGGEGGFYTAEDYREIVAYARERFVEVVPEIDVPGHTNAALAAYAELNCDGKPREPYTGIEVGFSSLCLGSPATDRFLADVVRTVAGLTPGPYIHIGGDEADATPPDDYRKFIEKVQKLVRANGKSMVGWQEIAAVPPAEDTLTQYWRSNVAPDDPLATVRNGGKLIMSPADKTYIAMKYDPSTRLGFTWAGYIEVRDAYDWDPAATIDGVTDKNIVGVESALWTETLSTMDELELFTFPRLPALAEVAWSPQASRDFAGFAVRLAAHGPRWTRLGIDFHRSPQIPWAS
ncbi:beta-N-acetylhexosaminidase [Sinosporangium siamense]|uniref:beta-N-acetylhexosaminidase n=1 Tax=Sinosporangium siamense TaxID=1367973 RepID=A0A919V724_9ACTN|nr:beta-N-acetylhexosaminidase [Sinosporangium siamense]